MLLRSRIMRAYTGDIPKNLNSKHDVENFLYRLTNGHAFLDKSYDERISTNPVGSANDRFLKTPRGHYLLCGSSLFSEIIYDTRMNALF